MAGQRATCVCVCVRAHQRRGLARPRLLWRLAEQSAPVHARLPFFPPAGQIALVLCLCLCLRHRLSVFRSRVSSRLRLAPCQLIASALDAARRSLSEPLIATSRTSRTSCPIPTSASPRPPPRTATPRHRRSRRPHSRGQTPRPRLTRAPSSDPTTDRGPLTSRRGHAGPTAPAATAPARAQQRFDCRARWLPPVCRLAQHRLRHTDLCEDITHRIV